MPDVKSMPSWVLLFRGINVGGNNLLPMKALVLILQNLGFDAVKTYIQSGNVVFRASKLPAKNIVSKIAAAIEKDFGFNPKILLLSAVDLHDIVAENPFVADAAEPKMLHCFFLSEAPGDPDVKGLDAILGEDEAYLLTERALYLHAPQGIGRSKFAQRAEKLIGVSSTARNWRTVSKIVEMTA